MMKTVISLLGLIFFGVNYNYCQVTYVNSAAAGTNDGTTWENAYTDIQSAIDDIRASEVWISTGTYISPRPITDSLSSYLIRRNISIYGGFNLSLIHI